MNVRVLPKFMVDNEDFGNKSNYVEFYMLIMMVLIQDEGIV